jgi:[ribosomal protein S18]-alanine N-acetyltransferase
MEVERELFGIEAWSSSTFRSELADKETRYYLVATEDDRVVGYAGLAILAHEAHVLTIGVSVRHQGRGIGTALLRNLLAEADRRGASSVLLDVRVDNEAAQRIYQRHGFRPIGVRRGYYQPSGTDAVVMRRG